MSGLAFTLLCALCALAVAGCEPEPNPLPLGAQIVPHVNPVNLCQSYIPASGMAEQAYFDLMLFNRGQERLEITEVDVTADRRCTFATPNGDVRLYDNDEGDDFLATAKSRDAAFMRITYASPAEPGDDEIKISIHSNAENYPEPAGLDVYVCAGGTTESTLTCRIRMDPACNDSAANAFSCEPGPESLVATPCPSSCEASGAECRPPTIDDPVGLPCPEGDRCMSPYYCVPDLGVCRDAGGECNPSDVPPCAGTCSISDVACDHATPCAGGAGDFCESTDVCVVRGECRDSGEECTLNTNDEPCAEDDRCVTQGSCYCRPCSVPPDEGWDDCPGA
jgi:hypothetical protein